MSALSCTLGHQFTALAKPPERCPYCPGGKPCPGTVGAVAPASPQRRPPTPAEAAIYQAIHEGAELEVLHTGRWYPVDAARLMATRVEVRFTTGTGPRLKRVPPSDLRRAQATA